MTITINDVDVSAQQAKNMAANYLHQQGWEKLAGHNPDDVVWGKTYKGLYVTGNTEFAMQLERNMK